MPKLSRREGSRFGHCGGDWLANCQPIKRTYILGWLLRKTKQSCNPMLLRTRMWWARVSSNALITFEGAKQVFYERICSERACDFTSDYERSITIKAYSGSSTLFGFGSDLVSEWPWVQVFGRISLLARTRVHVRNLARFGTISKMAARFRKTLQKPANTHFFLMHIWTFRQA